MCCSDFWIDCFSHLASLQGPETIKHPLCRWLGESGHNQVKSLLIVLNEFCIRSEILISMEQLHLISIWRHRISTQLYRICDFGFAKQLRADNGMLMTPCYTGNLFALVNYEENDKIVRNMIDIKSKLILSLDMSNLQQGLMVILNMMKINGLFRQICVKKQGLMKTFKKKVSNHY